MVASIRRYCEQELDEEIGPTVYNQAIADAQGWMLGRVEDLDGSLYEPVFGFWHR
jgi:uncharacterized protein (DUF2164 family)